MWDQSRPFPPGSKWRRVTESQRAQQARTAEALRRETEILRAGGAVPVPKRRGHGRGTRKLVAPIGGFDAQNLWAFLATPNGLAIASLIAAAEDEQHQLRIARAYRAVLAGEPGAHEAWGQIVRQLGC